MCGRYIFAKKRKDLLRRYGLDKDFDEHGPKMPSYILPLFNVVPTMRMPVIVLANGKRVLRLMHWGLIAPWSDAPRMKYATANARAEGIATSALYREPLKQRRCLVPSTGFYEWTGTAKTRLPHCIQMADGEIYSYAGLWEHWQSKDQSLTIDSFTIITTTPNDLMIPIADRMPAILDEKDEDRWLDPATPVEECLTLLKPYTAKEMREYRVSSAVNKAGVEGPELMMPLSTPEPAQLDFTTLA